MEIKTVAQTVKCMEEDQMLPVQTDRLARMVLLLDQEVRPCPKPEMLHSTAVAAAAVQVVTVAATITAITVV